MRQEPWIDPDDLVFPIAKLQSVNCTKAPPARTILYYTITATTFYSTLELMIVMKSDPNLKNLELIELSGGQYCLLYSP